jgi:predicted DNA-binding transcriptional regulator YafY
MMSAWKLVKQPNGLFARFALVLGDFTHWNMTTEEAAALCESIGERAELKLYSAIRSSGRFGRCIETIRGEHGEAMATYRNVELRKSKVERDAEEAQRRRTRFKLMRDLSKAMREPDSFVVRLIYRGDDGKRQMRTLSPIRFNGTHSMQAMCLSRAEPRVFILDRVEKVIATVPADSVLMPCPIVEVEG